MFVEKTFNQTGRIQGPAQIGFALAVHQGLLIRDRQHLWYQYASIWNLELSDFERWHPGATARTNSPWSMLLWQGVSYWRHVSEEQQEWMLECLYTDEDSTRQPQIYIGPSNHGNLIDVAIILSLACRTGALLDLPEAPNLVLTSSGSPSSSSIGLLYPTEQHWLCASVW